MPSCPQCGTPVRLGSLAPENTEVASRGMAVAKWRQAHCQKCQVVLEVVPWTQYLGLAICIMTAFVPVIMGSVWAAKLFPGNAFLEFLNRPKNGPQPSVPSYFVLVRLLVYVLYILWFYLSPRSFFRGLYGCA